MQLLQWKSHYNCTLTSKPGDAICDIYNEPIPCSVSHSLDVVDTFIIDQWLVKEGCSNWSCLFHLTRVLFCFHLTWQHFQVSIHWWLYHYVCDVRCRNVWMHDLQKWQHCTGKGGQCVYLTTLLTSCADCLEIWEPECPGTIRTCLGLKWNSLTISKQILHM